MKAIIYGSLGACLLLASPAAAEQPELWEQLATGIMAPAETAPAEVAPAEMAPATEGAMMATEDTAAEGGVIAPAEAAPSFYAEEPQKVEPAAGGYNWSGFYIGAFASYDFAEADMRRPAPSSPEIDGATGGVRLGYDYSPNNDMLFGIELEGSWGAMDTSFQEINGQYAARLRLGKVFLQDNMVYLTGGASVIDFDSTVPGTGATLVDEFIWGAQGGLGYERVLAEHLTWRFEYLYSNYADESSSTVAGGSADVDGHSVRGGFSLKY